MGIPWLKHSGNCFHPEARLFEPQSGSGTGYFCRTKVSSRNLQHLIEMHVCGSWVLSLLHIGGALHCHTLGNRCKVCMG